MKIGVPFAIRICAPLLVLALSRQASAECTGPAECCVETAADVVGPRPTRVRFGLRVMRLRAISEQAGTYNAEIALLTRWRSGGLRPDPRPRNAGSGYTVVLDSTFLSGNQCYRELRLQGDFQTWFRLRRFPFDAQDLRLHVEERHSGPTEIVFERELWPSLVSVDAIRELSGWRFSHTPMLNVRRSSFSYPSAAPRPTLLVVSFPIHRLSLFFVTRYFLPLIVIVMLAYSLFWIRPDDLGSSASVGVTCLLAIITFQITQAADLPRVPYLTIADRVYILCYLATAVAIATAVRGGVLVAGGRAEQAKREDRVWRWLFPAALVLAAGAAVASGWSDRNPTDDSGIVPAPAVRPAGEPDQV